MSSITKKNLAFTVFSPGVGDPNLRVAATTRQVPFWMAFAALWILGLLVPMCSASVISRASKAMDPTKTLEQRLADINKAFRDYRLVFHGLAEKPFRQNFVDALNHWHGKQNDAMPMVSTSAIGPETNSVWTSCGVLLDVTEDAYLYMVGPRDLGFVNPGSTHHAECNLPTWNFKDTDVAPLKHAKDNYVSANDNYTSAVSRISKSDGWHDAAINKTFNNGRSQTENKTTFRSLDFDWKSEMQQSALEKAVKDAEQTQCHNEAVVSAKICDIKAFVEMSLNAGKCAWLEDSEKMEDLRKTFEKLCGTAPVVAKYDTEKKLFVAERSVAPWSLVATIMWMLLMMFLTRELVSS